MEFFMEETGIKIEYVDKEDVLATVDPCVKLWLRVVDPKKRRDKHKENEAIEFTFTIEKGMPIANLESFFVLTICLLALLDDADEVAHALVNNSPFTLSVCNELTSLFCLRFIVHSRLLDGRGCPNNSNAHQKSNYFVLTRQATIPESEAGTAKAYYLFLFQ